LKYLSFSTIATRVDPNHLKSATVYGNQHKLCLEGTRTKMLAAILKWIDDPICDHKMFYLVDIPGSGKSTVSKELSKELGLRQRLVGQFFLSYDTEETMSIRHFCLEVYDAFANQSNEFKQYAATFKERSSFMNLSFEDQFEGLVMGPLRLLNQPAVLIVDAVYKCNNDCKGWDHLLNAIHARHAMAPLLRIFVTG
jgi:hypothetical protein